MPPFCFWGGLQGMPMKNAKVRKWLDGYPWIGMRIEAYRREMEETFKPTRTQKYEEARLLLQVRF